MLAKRKTLFVCLLVKASLLAAGAGIDAERYLADVKYLASPELKGRGTGTPQLERAAEYIAGQFRKVGLKPVKGGCEGSARSCTEYLGNYFQPLPVTTNAKLGPRNAFEYVDAGKKRSLKSEDDYVPFNFSSTGKFSGEVVFAGYGITAPEYGYDDYAGLDVRDKIVLVMRHEPQEFDEKSVFAGKLFSGHAQFWSKAANAKLHGARAVILVNDRANHKHHDDRLADFGRTAGPADSGIGFVQVKAEVAEKWLKQAGKSFENIQEAIDKDLKPRSFALPGSTRLEIEVDVERQVKTVHNITAFLPGETSEYIVIGAHYDHLGLGEHSSMAPSMAGTPHLGADDNASGTAGVLELARWFSKQPRRKRGVLFVAFAGEELGLLGSSWYVNHPGLPLSDAVAMLNLDMIGRIREGKVYIGGIATGTTFQKALDPLVAKYKLRADFSGTDGYGSSDHASFTAKQVPVLFFFSGLHGDYHRPSDTWDKINARGASELLSMIGELTVKLLEAPDRPQFVRVAQEQAVGGGGDASGYGPYFGSVPDFAETAKGVKFADVKENSPAGKAGLRAGDILVEFDGKPIENLYDFTYALRSKQPGDKVDVKVLRGAESVDAKVLLTERK